MKTKLTFLELNTFKSMIPVSRDELNEFFGGGCGVSSAYSLSKYAEMGDFTNGLVQFSPDDVCYLTQDYNDYCGGTDYSGSGYSGSSEYSGSSDYPGTSGYSGDSDYSGSSDGSGNSSYSGISFSYNAANYYSGASAYSYFEAYSIVCNLVDELPPCVRDRLSNVSIEYNSCNSTPGSYSFQNDAMSLRKLAYTTLFAECVHVTQDQTNYGGENHAAREYQEHILGDLEAQRRFIVNDCGYSPHTVDLEHDDGYSDWLQSCIDEDTGEVIMSTFLERAGEFETQFMSSHPDNNGYQGNIPSNYNYNWQEMLRELGFKIRY